jgi:hypothetical protein
MSQINEIHAPDVLREAVLDQLVVFLLITTDKNHPLVRGCK